MNDCNELPRLELVMVWTTLLAAFWKKANEFLKEGSLWAWSLSTSEEAPLEEDMEKASPESLGLEHPLLSVPILGRDFDDNWNTIKRKLKISEYPPFILIMIMIFFSFKAPIRTILVIKIKWQSFQKANVLFQVWEIIRFFQCETVNSFYRKCT